MKRYAMSVGDDGKLTLELGSETVEMSPGEAAVFSSDILEQVRLADMIRQEYAAVDRMRRGL